MRNQFPAPRLLPTTIAFTVVLLAVKSGILLNGAVFRGPKPDSAMVTPAHANEAGSATPTAHGPPIAGGAPPSLPAPSHAPVANPPTAKSAPDNKPAGPGTRSVVASGAPVEPETPAVSEGEKALLQDLRQRREQLDAQADALKVRETVLTAAEQKLTNRVGELQALQHRLEELDGAQKQKEAAGWQGLAKMYEAMKPRDAATIFNDLAMPVLLQVLDRMKDAKAALVMAAMNPDKARDVTAELARLRLGHDPATQPDETRAPSAAS